MAIGIVTREGIKLSCRATGPTESTRAVLLIHGLNTNMAFWHPLLVRQLSADRQLILYDQRGHGASDLPESGYTLADLAEDARAVLDAHGVESADIVAHSFGSGVAMQLARTYPQRVRSLTILDGRLRSLQGEVRLRDWTFFGKWSEQFDAAGIAIDPDWEIDCLLPLKMESIDFSLVSEGMQAHGFFVPRTNKRAGSKYRQLMTETKALADYENPCGLTRETLHEVTQPTLLIYGAMSPFLPTCKILAAELPDAQVAILDDAGHNFPITKPEQTLGAMAEWSASRPLPDLSGNPQN